MRFSQYLDFFHPQIPDFQILSYHNIHQWKYDLFSFQMMYKSQFRKMDPYCFVVQGHILCLIYQNIISAFVTAG